MPTTTETGPVRSRSRRRCDNPRIRRDSHSTWTRARGLHTPYGAPRTPAGAPTTPTGPTSVLGYTSAPTDPNGQLNLNARQYDPALGQFTSTDPAGKAGSAGYGGWFASPYGYVNGRTTTMTDPTGLNCWNPWSSEGEACAVWDALDRTLSGQNNDSVVGNIASSTSNTFVNLGRGAMGGATDTIDNAISEGASETVDSTSGVARFTQALGFAGSLISGGAGSAAAHGAEVVADGAAAATERAAALADRAASAGGQGASRTSEAVDAAVARQTADAAETVGPSVADLRAAGLSDAHHIIQDAAVRDLPGYSTRAAPGVQLSGPSTLAGTEHYAATVVQRAAGGGTYAAERQIAFNALKAAGFSDADAAAAVARADSYFIKELGIDMDTPTRIPGNRAGQ